MKSRRVRFSPSLYFSTPSSVALHEERSLKCHISFPFTRHSHPFSICIFDCRWQEAAAGRQGPRPHADQALKADRQEVSLRQRTKLAYDSRLLLLAVCFCVVALHAGICLRRLLLMSSFDGSQGTNTFDRYEMRIYKRVIDVDTSVETIRTLVRIYILMLRCS